MTGVVEVAALVVDSRLISLPSPLRSLRQFYRTLVETAAVVIVDLYSSRCEKDAREHKVHQEVHRQSKDAEPDSEDEVRLCWYDEVCVMAFKVFLVPPAVLSIRRGST